MRPIFFFKLLLPRLVLWGFAARGFFLRPTPKIPATREKKTSGRVPRVVTKVLLLIVFFSHVSQSFLAKSVFFVFTCSLLLRTRRILEKRLTAVTASPGWKQSIFLQPVSSRPFHMQLHMSLVDRAGPVTGRIPPWVHSPVSEMRNQNEKRPKILGTSSGAKANMARNKIYNIRAYESFGNSWSCITAATVFIRLKDALYQTRQMEAKLPINAALESGECGVYSRIIRKRNLVTTW